MGTIIEVEVVSGEPEYTLVDICERCGVAEDIVVEYVEYGIAPYNGEYTADWRFDIKALSRLQKAIRLQRDLDINLPGLALALDLLDEIQELRIKQQHLLSRQEIFSHD